MHNYITTYSGEKIDPLDPKEEQINITDIAHALSLLCRGSGHIEHFYSVAQHCVNCAKEARARGYSKRIQLACLMHDGSEAYVSDITRPVKKHLPRYLEIEDNFQSVVYKRFLGANLTKEEEDTIQKIDDDVLVWELIAIMKRDKPEIMPELKSSPVFDFLLFSDVEKEFMAIYESLV